MPDEPIYREADAPIEQRVADLLNRMTLEEKVHQLASYFPNANVRLGIPHLQPGECLHGLGAPRGTSFPIPLGLGCTWDPELIERLAGVCAREARALGIHQCYSPMLGVGRDPRWGRIEECYGEDPHLVARMGEAFVAGLQGRGERFLDREHIVATAKHYVADGEPIGGRNGAPVEISRRSLHEVHLPPFRAAVEHANCQSVMPAHHSINGVPCHANAYILDEVLRKQYGFDGATVCDNGDIRGLAGRMRFAPSVAHAARMALEAGVDWELAWMKPWDETRAYGQPLIEAVESGEVPVKLVDRAASRVLTLKYRLGLFDDGAEINPDDDPLVSPDKIESTDEEVAYSETKRSFGRPRADAEDVLTDPASDEIALTAARRALVLLKNDGLLPLDRQKVGKIAVIGPNADAVRLGGYSTNEPRHFVTVLAGVRELAGDTEVDYQPGCEIDPDDSGDGIASAATAARGADAAIVVIGGSEETCKENEDRDGLELIGPQGELVDAVAATGTPMVLVLQHGRPLEIDRCVARASAVIDGWFGGQDAGRAIAEAIFGEINPGGKLSISIPRRVGQVPCYYNQLPHGRTPNYYRSTDEPLFPFGFGLSYTSFELSAPTLDDAEIAADGATMVRVTVTNTGDRAGDEVVQLYVRDEVSSLTRPILELKGFRRVSLEPGASETVALPIGPRQLEFYKDGEWIVEDGEFTILTGASSADLQETTLTVS